MLKAFWKANAFKFDTLSFGKISIFLSSRLKCIKKWTLSIVSVLTKYFEVTFYTV
jgi:hypothetical protein